MGKATGVGQVASSRKKWQEWVMGAESGGGARGWDWFRLHR